MEHAALIEKLIEKLDSCPCCPASVLQVNKPEDGIPDEMVHDTVFSCGARVQITADARFHSAYPCPLPIEDRLGDILRDAEEECDL